MVQGSFFHEEKTFANQKNYSFSDCKTPFPVEKLENYLRINVAKPLEWLENLNHFGPPELAMTFNDRLVVLTWQLSKLIKQCRKTVKCQIVATFWWITPQIFIRNRVE